MVLHNQQIGEVKGITIIELGNGDTKVAYLHQPEEGYTGVMFKNDVQKPIGTKGNNPPGITTDEMPPDAMIIFTNVESIEVVERALAKAKIILKGRS